MASDKVKKIRIKEYIDAVDQIIKENGKQAVTIRNLAKRLNYNSALLYKYFKNVDHLLFLHSMGILSGYAKRLEKEVYSIENPLERFLGIWRLFAEESFKAPEAYYSLFFTDKSDSFNDSVKLYYEIFSDVLDNAPEEVMPMLLERHIYKRDYKALEVCAKHGYLKWEDLDDINYMIMLMYQGFLVRAKDGLLEYSKEKSLTMLMKYIGVVIDSYRVDGDGDC